MTSFDSDFFTVSQRDGNVILGFTAREGYGIGDFVAFVDRARRGQFHGDGVIGVFNRDGDAVW
ncbi:hypothetical protein FCV83_24485 [Enterovibrio norvegicus]|nr:hypothetical protein FCV83_24485 [Enterovibrio norvegicus]